MPEAGAVFELRELKAFCSVTGEVKRWQVLFLVHRSAKVPRKPAQRTSGKLANTGRFLHVPLIFVKKKKNNFKPSPLPTITD